MRSEGGSAATWRTSSSTIPGQREGGTESVRQRPLEGRPTLRERGAAGEDPRPSVDSAELPFVVQMDRMGSLVLCWRRGVASRGDRGWCKSTFRSSCETGRSGPEQDGTTVDTSKQTDASFEAA